MQYWPPDNVMEWVVKPTKLQPFVSVTIFSFGEDRSGQATTTSILPDPLTSNHPQQHLADSCDALTSRQLQVARGLRNMRHSKSIRTHSSSTRAQEPAEAARVTWPYGGRGPRVAGVGRDGGLTLTQRKMLRDAPPLASQNS